MTDTQHAYDEQATLWNGLAGRAWVDVQATLDHLFQPLEDLLVEATRSTPAGRVLDVGCGTGAITRALARRQGAQGHCTGIDISEPMIAAARTRAEREGLPASFICADVQTHTFEPASFDLIVSRLGVMFFDDPVLAFANLRSAARHGAQLRFIAWRSAAENPFMTTAERAAAPLLPNLPVPKPGAPGQFAFADRHRIEALLEDSGWTGIDIQPVDLACAFPKKDLRTYLSRLGPVGLALAATDEPARAQVIETIRTAFEPYVRGYEVRLTAACWMVGARAPSASAAPKEAANV